MALLIGSLVVNVLLLIAVHKLITRAHQAESDSKMYKDDSNYWHRKHQTAIEELHDVITNSK